MRHPDKLGHIGRLDIICRIREILFLDPETGEWDYNRVYGLKNHNACLAIRDIFLEYGLAPDHETRKQCPCSTCQAERETSAISGVSITEHRATSESGS